MVKHELTKTAAKITENGMKKTPAGARLLWIDLEMTGLDPEKDRILEVAAIATGWDLAEIANYEGVVKVDEKLIQERMVGEFWEKNAQSRDGLIAQNQHGKSAREIENELLNFVDEWFDAEIILAGNSIHQDRKFIDREWPRLAARLHYRMLDVSAWKVYMEGARGQKFLKRDLHRALDDIRGSIEELKWYTEMLKEVK